MERLTFKDIVQELRRRGYMGEGTPKKITIEAMPEKVLVHLEYNCDIPFSETASFMNEEWERRRKQ